MRVRGSCSKQVCMNNEWLVWQIRRGQTSAEEAACVAVWCVGCAGREYPGDEDNFISPASGPRIRKADTCDTTADLSLSPRVTNYCHKKIQHSRARVFIFYHSKWWKVIWIIYFFSLNSDCRFHKHMVTAHWWPFYTGGRCQTLQLPKDWKCHVTFWTGTWIFTYSLIF